MKDLSQEHIDSIDAYINGELSTEEKLVFESRLVTDNELNEAFKLVTGLNNIIAFDKNKSYKKSLQNLEAKTGKVKSRIRPLYIVAAIAASLALVFMITSNLNNQKEDLFATYFKAYPNTVIYIIRGESETNPVQQAFINYQQGSFEESLILFKQLRNDVSKDTLDFYLAINYMALNQFEKAQTQLNLLDLSNSKAYEEAKEWYQILVLLATKEEAKAKLAVDKYIQEGYSFNRTKAKELSNILN